MIKSGRTLDLKSYLIVGKSLIKKGLGGLSSSGIIGIHPLALHMIDAGLMAISLAKSMAFNRQFRIFQESLNNYTRINNRGVFREFTKEDYYNILGFLIPLHDFGKLAPNFQEYIWSKGGMDIKEFLGECWAGGSSVIFENASGVYHNQYGFTIIEKFFRYFFDLSDSVIGGDFNYFFEVLQSVIKNHHYYSKAFFDEEEAEIWDLWRPIRDSSFNYLLNLFNISRGDLEYLFGYFDGSDMLDPRRYNFSIIEVILLGFAVISDWLVSSESLFLSRLYGDEELRIPSLDEVRRWILEGRADGNYQVIDLLEYKRVVEDLAMDLVNLLGFNSEVSFRDINEFKDIYAFQKLRSVQVLAELISDQINDGPALVIMEAPTGDGKTEAAFYLYTSWNRNLGIDGFYIALPTQATSNQMYNRTFKTLRGLIEDLKSKSKRDVETLEINLKLVHGMSWIYDKTYDRILDDRIQAEDFVDVGESETVREEIDAKISWFQPTRKAILAPFGVGTVDQAMLSVMKVKFVFLRLFGLGNKVIIVDEVHAYDVYMSTIINGLLTWCAAFGIPVVLLSATLPKVKRKELIESYKKGLALNGRDHGVQPGSENHLDSVQSQTEPYPLITAIKPDGMEIKLSKSDISGKAEELLEDKANVRKILKLRLLKGYLNDDEKIAEFAWDAINSVRIEGNGKCCICLLVNTVQLAQDVYLKLEKLKEQGGKNILIKLFHARFLAGERKDIEDEVEKLFGKDAGDLRPDRAILVATQVVEQSLDLDFDWMITEIAPIDLLIQRAGRIFRHERNTRPFAHGRLDILLPDIDDVGGEITFSKTSHVYNKFILLKTLDVLLQHAGKDRYDCEFEVPADVRPFVDGVYRRYDNIDDLENSIGWFFRANKGRFKTIRCAWERFREGIIDDRNNAEKYLIDEPNGALILDTSFYEGVTLEESENEKLRWLKARTRKDLDSIRIIWLEEGNKDDDTLIEAFTPKNGKKRYKPPGETIRKILEKSVPIPFYTLPKNTEPKNGFKKVKKSPWWLRGFRIIVANCDGVWEGINHDTERDKQFHVFFQYDKRIGLKFEKKIIVGKNNKKEVI
ncbi:MAG: CRISPR-associated helicase Cas3' [Promethearchaeota archaeon]